MKKRKLTAIGFIATVTAVRVTVALASDIDASPVRAAEFATTTLCIMTKAIIKKKKKEFSLKDLQEDVC